MRARAKNRVVKTIEKDNFNVVVYNDSEDYPDGDSLDHFYYTFYSTNNEFILSIQSLKYSEIFLDGLVNYYSVLFNAVPTTIIIELLSDVIFNNNDSDSTKRNNSSLFIQMYIDKNRYNTSLETLIVRLLIRYYNNYAKLNSTKILAEKFVQDNSRTEFYNSDGSVNEDKVYTYLYPILYGCNSEEIDFIIKNRAENSDTSQYTETITKIRALYYNADYIENKNILVKDFTITDSMLEVLRKKENQYTKNEEHIDLFFQYTAFDNRQRFKNYVNNLTVSEILIIMKELMSNNTAIIFNNNDDLVEEYLNYIKDNETLLTDSNSDEATVLQQIVIDSKNDFVNKSFTRTENIFDDRISYFEKKIYIILYNFLMDYALTTTMSDEMFKSKIDKIYEYIYAHSMFNFYFITTCRNSMSDDNIFDFLCHIADNDVYLTIEQSIHYMNNYEEYESLPMSWRIELL